MTFAEQVTAGIHSFAEYRAAILTALSESGNTSPNPRVVDTLAAHCRATHTDLSKYSVMHVIDAYNAFRANQH